MHASGGHVGYPPGYYVQGQHHPSGQFRPPSYHHLSGSSSPSFQSMTSHWNISAPASHTLPIYQSHSYGSSVGSGGSSGGGSSGKSKHSQPMLALQQPKPPDKPLLPYMRYSRKMWEQLKAEGKRVWEVGKIIGQKWREMPDEDKQPFFEEYEAEKAIYTEQLKAYRNSPAYKRWLEVKQQADAAAREAASLGHAHNEYGPPPPSVIAPPRGHSAEARVQIMQHEDEEDEYITMKQVAAVRFHRNHRLMLEIFDKNSHLNTRAVVTKERLNTLMKQVQSLQQHQAKLEGDLKGIDGKFEAKKRKFLEDSEKFRRELKQIQDNPPTSWKKLPTAISLKDVPQPVDNPKYKKL